MTPRRWFLSGARYVGGAERYVEWLLGGLRPGEFGLCSFDAPGVRPWLDRLAARGVDVRVIGGGSLLGQASALHRFLRSVRAELLHVNLPGPYDCILGAAPAIARWAGVPRVITTEHLPSVGRVGKRWYAKQWGVRNTALAIAVCRAHERALQDLGYAASRIVVIPNGVRDLGVARPREDVAELRILQVGALDSRKGVDLLLHAFAAILGSGLDCRLRLAGGGPERGRLEALARELGVDARVDFLGQVDDVGELLRQADVVTLCSWREGMPLSLLEAASAARPMVASAVDGVPEIVRDGDTGFVVPPGDSQALAARLRELLRDPALRATMGARARSLYEAEHRLETMIERTRALYES